MLHGSQLLTPATPSDCPFGPVPPCKGHTRHRGPSLLSFSMNLSCQAKLYSIWRRVRVRKTYPVYLGAFQGTWYGAHATIDSMPTSAPHFRGALPGQLDPSARCLRAHSDPHHLQRRAANKRYTVGPREHDSNGTLHLQRFLPSRGLLVFQSPVTNHQSPFDQQNMAQQGCKQVTLPPRATPRIRTGRFERSNDILYSLGVL